MKYPALFCIAFMLCICTPKESFADKEFRYPGQELNGTWQVVKHDFRGTKDMDSPETKKSFDSFLKDDRYSTVMILPIGQKIVFEMTGESIGYGIPGHYRDGMAIGMKLLLPIVPEICKASGWNYLCDKNGNLDLYNEKKYIRKKIKDGAYTVADVDSGLLNYDLNGVGSEIRKLWPNIKKHSYTVSLNDGSFLFFVYPMKDDKEIMFNTDFGEKRDMIGIILERIK